MSAFLHRPEDIRRLVRACSVMVEGVERILFELRQLCRSSIKPVLVLELTRLTLKQEITLTAYIHWYLWHAHYTIRKLSVSRNGFLLALLYSNCSSYRKIFSSRRQFCEVTVTLEVSIVSARVRKAKSRENLMEGTQKVTDDRCLSAGNVDPPTSLRMLAVLEQVQFDHFDDKPSLHHTNNPTL